MAGRRTYGETFDVTTGSEAVLTCSLCTSYISVKERRLYCRGDADPATALG